MTIDQEERLIEQFRLIAGALSSIAKTMELEYSRKYPPKKEPRDVDITYVKTEEEALREEQGDTGEATLSEWTTIGPREKAVLERQARSTAGNGAPKTGD